MNEHEWDRLLKIRTSGRDDSHADRFRYPYEPTPYPVLERLAGSGYISKKNTLVDYGCGKGRAGFYLSWQCGCRSIGIEFDERIYRTALTNKDHAVSRRKTDFHREKAESWQVPETVDRCYFFNPFSVEILQKVIKRVRESRYICPREILFFFYYPSDEYVSCLMTAEDLLFLDEIDCRDLFAGKSRRERIMIFRMG